MFGSPAATPAPPPLPDPLPATPQYASSGTKAIAGNNGKIAGQGSTLLTSGQGDLTPSNTTRKSLLGQ